MISIVTLNWNTTDMTLRLYKSIQENTKQNFKFYVLDNGSESLEYEKLFDLFTKNEQVSRSEKNLGFAAGNNVICKSIRNLDHGHVFFINSDIIVQEKDWDLKMVHELEQNYVGIVGCAYHPLIWTKDGKFHIQPKVDHPVESQSVQGAFFGIREDIFDNLIDTDGFIFDENFRYAHYEETDLCFKLRKKNYKITWVPVNHLHDYKNSATLKNKFQLNDEIKNQEDFKRNSEKNRQLFIEKHKDLL